MTNTSLQSEISIPSKVEYLGIVNDFLKKTLEKFGLAKTKIADVQIAVSEACTNVIMYGYGNQSNGRIDIWCYLTERNCVIKIRDYGKPFNPLAVDAPNVNCSLSEREVGGLGIFLMRQLLDEFKYEYNQEHGYETLTMIKYQ